MTQSELRERFEREYPNKVAILRSTGTAGLAYAIWLELQLIEAEQREREAFEAGRETEITGTGAELDLVNLYPTFDDYKNQQIKEG